MDKIHFAPLEQLGGLSRIFFFIYPKCEADFILSKTQVTLRRWDFNPWLGRYPKFGCLGNGVPQSLGVFAARGSGLFQDDKDRVENW